MPSWPAPRREGGQQATTARRVVGHGRLAPLPLGGARSAAPSRAESRGRTVFHFVATDEHPICDTAIGERIIRLARKAGVRLTMRSLRRGFGCHYAGKVPAQVLQKLMRHASISTTMSYYANVDDAAMEAVLGKKDDRKAP